MALFDITGLRAGGGTGLHGDDVSHLVRALQEIQSIQLSLVEGDVLADIDMDLAGIKVGDTIMNVMEQVVATGAIAAHAGTVTITAAGKIQSDEATTGKNLLVQWASKPA